MRRLPAPSRCLGHASAPLLHNRRGRIRLLFCEPRGCGRRDERPSRCQRAPDEAYRLRAPARPRPALAFEPCGADVGVGALDRSELVRGRADFGCVVRRIGGKLGYLPSGPSGAFRGGDQGLEGPEVLRFDEFRVETLGSASATLSMMIESAIARTFLFFGFDTHRISKGSLPVSSAGS